MESSPKHTPMGWLRDITNPTHTSWAVCVKARASGRIITVTSSGGQQGALREVAVKRTKVRGTPCSLHCSTSTQSDGHLKTKDLPTPSPHAHTFTRK